MLLSSDRQRDKQTDDRQTDVLDNFQEYSWFSNILLFGMDPWTI